MTLASALNSLATRRIEEHCHDCLHWGDRSVLGEQFHGQVGCTLDRSCTVCFLGRASAVCPLSPPLWGQEVPS